MKIRKSTPSDLDFFTFWGKGDLADVYHGQKKV